jgi:exosortase A
MFLKPPPDIADRPRARLAPRSVLAIAIALLAPFLFYFGTAKSIVAIWNNSDTFAHGYIILPISLWLVWRRRANFAAFPPTPYWPALALPMLVGFGWLLARMGEVQVVMQYAFVAMIPIIALAILGWRLAWSLAFPLLFLLLAVPFGEIFIEPLISFTADFTVAALQATGIPVLRNGTRFEIPSGSWSVVEACSGVRYLISSVTIGCLYAYLTYRSNARRLLFIAVSVVVPVIANGLRAYMIVMLGHLSGMQLAVGVDHLIYGWVFFGIVMFVMFWIGSRWREDADAAPAAAHAADTGGAGAAPRPVVAMALALVAAIAIWPAFAEYNDRATFSPKPVRLDRIAVDWAPAAPFAAWTPRFAPASARFDGVFQADSGAGLQPVGLTVLYYRNQSNGKALISSTNRLVNQNDAWHQVGSSMRGENAGTGPLAVRETRLQGAAGAILVWQWNWIGQQATANNYVGKLWQAKEKLLFRGDDGAAVLVSAPYMADPEEARKAMRAFLGANRGAIDAALLAARSN